MAKVKGVKADAKGDPTHLQQRWAGFIEYECGEHEYSHFLREGTVDEQASVSCAGGCGKKHSGTVRSVGTPGGGR